MIAIGCFRWSVNEARNVDAVKLPCGGLKRLRSYSTQWSTPLSFVKSLVFQLSCVVYRWSAIPRRYVNLLSLIEFAFFTFANFLICSVVRWTSRTLESLLECFIGNLVMDFMSSYLGTNNASLQCSILKEKWNPYQYHWTVLDFSGDHEALVATLGPSRTALLHYSKSAARFRCQSAFLIGCLRCHYTLIPRNLVSCNFLPATVDMLHSNVPCACLGEMVSIRLLWRSQSTTPDSEASDKDRSSSGTRFVLRVGVRSSQSVVMKWTKGSWELDWSIHLRGRKVRFGWNFVWCGGSWWSKDCLWRILWIVK